MKFKITAAILALSLVATAFSACSKKPEEQDTTTTTTTTTEASSETTAPTTTTTTSEVNKVEVDSMETILSLIKDFPMGTAGSSVKSIAIALRLLNLSENLESKNDVKKAAKNYIESLSSNERAAFGENLGEIDYMARKIIAGPDERLKNNIADSGEKYSEDGYSLEKYEEVYDFMAAWSSLED